VTVGVGVAPVPAVPNVLEHRLDEVSSIAAVGIVEELVANPGLYVGTDTVRGVDLTAVARIAVTVLPGGAGVSLDYDVYNPGGSGPIRAHAEHTILAKGDDGNALMVVAHTHGEGVTVMHETEPGTFEPGDPAPPYPMRITLSAPAPGRLRHGWWYGRPGEPLEERDVAEVELQA